MRRFRIAIVFATLVAASGCYRYAPSDPTSIAPGTKVQAVLTPQGSDEVTQYLGPGVTQVEGPFAGFDGERISILREMTLHQAGFAPTTLTDTLHLESRLLRQVGVQELDGKKTAFFTVGVVGAALGSVLAALIFGGTSEEGNEGDPTIPPDDAVILRIPFSIPIGFQ